MTNFRLQTTHRTTRVLPISNSLRGRGNLGRSSMNTPIHFLALHCFRTKIRHLVTKNYCLASEGNEKFLFSISERATTTKGLIPFITRRV